MFNAGLLTFLVVGSFSLRSQSYENSLIFLFVLVYFFVSLCFRLSAFFLLQFLERRNLTLEPVVIYGVTSAGLQLVSALKTSRGMNVLNFVDENPAMQGAIVAGLKVISPDYLKKIVPLKKIKKVIIGLDRLSSQEGKKLETTLQTLDVRSYLFHQYPTC